MSEDGDRKMVEQAWAIKLGSGGRCIPFCAERGVVGLGWRMVDLEVLRTGSFDSLRDHVRERCGWYGSDGAISLARGQLWRFTRDCQVGEIIVYYDPKRKDAVFCRVDSEVERRSADDGDPVIDIWFVRRVSILRRIPILNLRGTVKGRLLGPRLSFWRLNPAPLVRQLAERGSSIQRNSEIEGAYAALVELVVEQVRRLNDKHWEALVAEYFRAQGAQIRGRVGGSQAVIDVEAHFPRGALGPETWRVQVKRLTERAVSAERILQDYENCGDCDRFGYVSAFGFTDEARQRADEANIALWEPRDFAIFLLSDRVGEILRDQLGFPALWGT